MNEQILDLLNCFKINEALGLDWKVLWCEHIAYHGQSFKHYCVVKDKMMFKLEENSNGILTGWLNMNDCHVVYKKNGEVENA